MKIVEDIQNARAAFTDLSLTIGSFDGVHLGHRRVLDELLSAARASGGPSALLTMRPHPRELFSPDHAPNLLTSHERKLRLLDEAGVDIAFVLEFTREVASLEPRVFVEQIIHDCCQAKQVIVGHDFRFGRNAEGDYEFLRELGPEFGFTVRQVAPLFIDGERVSSTLIRERVLQGDLAGAETFLGRKYSLVGQVVTGRGVGVQLGFPTANVEPHHTAVPAQGVYFAEAIVRGQRYPAAVNIGIAPTIRQEDIVVEAFLLDFTGDLLGCEIEIVFHKRIRSEKKFRSREELMQQIHDDVEALRGYFASL